MNKHNLLIKKIKKQILSINNGIESNFNKLKYFNKNYKKILLKKHNRVLLGLGIAVILTLFYFLIPTFYNKDIIQSQIKNQILKNYNINIKFKEKINYGLLPKPHFSAKNLLILRDENEIGVSKNLNIFIGVDQFFSINKVVIKDLVFNKTDFNVYIKDFLFFKNLLKTEPHANNIFFKKSNIFFKNKFDEVLFINKIDNSEFYFDFKNLKNVLSTKNEIFNIPYKLTIKNDKFNKQVFSEFNSKKIRLNVKNKIDYDEINKKGLLNILFVSKRTSLNYEIKKNSLSFVSDSKSNSYKGKIDFKPFYFKADFNYDGLSSKNIFNDESIFTDLIKSEILNNKNFNANISINIKDITNINELNQLFLKIAIEEGDINLSDTEIMWKEDLKISLNESYLYYDESGINLIGKIIFDFTNINSFYKSFQVQKKYRKEIDKIELDFIYNFDKNKIKLDNVKINSVPDSNVEEYLDKFNSKDKQIINKIILKNFISNFFRNY
jgi:hypothetical protein